MGGFHATLCPEEVGQFCESLVTGEAEVAFPELIDDYRHGQSRHLYTAASHPSLEVLPDRSIFRGNVTCRSGWSNSRGVAASSANSAPSSLFTAARTNIARSPE